MGRFTRCLISEGSGRPTSDTSPISFREVPIWQRRGGISVLPQDAWKSEAARTCPGRPRSLAVMELRTSHL